MSNVTKNNVVWVDFKTKREYDLSKFGHPEKHNPQIPCLCIPKKFKDNKNGSR